MNQILENFLYRKLIRSLMLTSRLGRRSVLGEAATGYNFDYMYQNKAGGTPIIGGLVDRALLNLPAVQATRDRRSNIVKILSNEIENHRTANQKTRIIDIACGAGRYLTDLNAALGSENVEIVGVDFDKQSLDLGKSLAKSCRIPTSTLRFMKGNIFQLKRLKYLGRSVDWSPNVIVSSGLTVYIDDEKVIDLLKQVYDELDRDGLFVVDSQESNPSRKLMEKVCHTKEGSWILHYRSPSFWRTQLRNTGFRDIIVSRDRWHMYNMCTARKPR